MSGQTNTAGNMPALVSNRGIPTEVWSALKNSLFPGASDHSVLMAWDYCKARGLDVMLKPVHLVPMYIKDKNNGDKGEMRDVVMPGIGLYRIQADRAGNYAGMSAPLFGSTVDYTLGGEKVSVPEWCEISVSKIVGDRVVTFTAREYWIENYATAGRDTQKPNAMWQKRPRGQLVKCAEAQALRKGWPELGAQPTAEEMEGKELDITARSERVGNDAPSGHHTISDDQVKTIELLLEKAGATTEEFTKALRIGSLQQLEVARFQAAVRSINKRIFEQGAHDSEQQGVEQ